jgi:outer membrane protein TolC
MKKLFLLITLTPALLLAQTDGLSLAETRATVLRDNPSVRESLQRIAAAEAVLKQAKSAYMPTITASSTYGSYNGSVHPDLDLLNRYSDGYTEASVSLTGSWLLFDGLARRARTLSAQYNVQSKQELADETRRLLIQSTTVAFRQAQLAKEKVKIANQDRSFNLLLEDDARKRFDAGTLPESDVHTFSINALLAESSALRAELDYKSACTVLAQLMALPEAELPPEFQPVAITFEPIETVPEFDTEFSFALAHRPDYLATYSGHQALAEQVNAAQGDRLPQVAFVSQFSYGNIDGYSIAPQHDEHTSFVGLTASWDLFTGGRKIGTVKEATAKMRALNEQQQSLRLSIRSALRQQIDAAETTLAVYERQEKIHTLSIQVRDSVEKAYKAGVTSITRLNEAQTKLIQAQGAHAAAYISSQLALNQLDIQTGRALTQ